VTGQRPTESEARVLAAIEDPAATEGAVATLLGRVPSSARFQLAEEWKARARNGALSDWRRLAAYRVLVERVIAYPCEKERFVREAITSIGLREAQITDMSRVGALPFERHPGERIFRASLPMRTAVGPASVYFAVSPDERHVRTAKVHPESVRRR
jgi:hypothetical protein